MKTLTITESEALLEYVQNLYGTNSQRKRGYRNHAIALLMLDAGLRVGEVVNLALSDLYWNSEPVKSIIIRAEIAKTKTERTIPVSERLSKALKSYALSYRPLKTGSEAIMAFCHPCNFKPLTTRQVERIIGTAGIKAIGRSVHPHMLRHTFASKLMRITNIRVVQELLGHKSLTSTQVYTHPNGDDLKGAIDAL